MGNLYNVEQKLDPKTVAGTSKGTTIGLNTWKAEIRKEIMEKLKGYSPDHIDKIIKATFGDLSNTQ